MRTKVGDNKVREFCDYNINPQLKVLQKEIQPIRCLNRLLECYWSKLSMTFSIAASNRDNKIT